MTGDELAAALYAEQGYLTLGTTAPLAIGEITTETSYGGGIPLRVIAKSNKAEHRRQDRTSVRLGLVEPVSNESDYFPFLYYYRVEAAD